MFKSAKRSLAGKKGLKFQFDVVITRAYSVIPGTTALQVVWKRGPKVASTRVAPVNNGEAIWKETLSMLVTLYRDTRTGRFDEKSCTFSVREISKKKDKGYGEVQLDLAQVAISNESSPPSAKRLPLRSGSKNLPTHIEVEIRSRWLENAKSGGRDSDSDISEMMSEASFGDDTEDTSSSKPSPAQSFTSQRNISSQGRQLSGIHEGATEDPEEIMLSDSSDEALRQAAAGVEESAGPSGYSSTKSSVRSTPEPRFNNPSDTATSVADPTTAVAVPVLNIAPSQRSLGQPSPSTPSMSTLAAQPVKTESPVYAPWDRTGSRLDEPGSPLNDYNNPFGAPAVNAERDAPVSAYNPVEATPSTREPTNPFEEDSEPKTEPAAAPLPVTRTPLFAAKPPLPPAAEPSNTTPSMRAAPVITAQAMPATPPLAEEHRTMSLESFSSASSQLDMEYVPPPSARSSNDRSAALAELRKRVADLQGELSMAASKLDEANERAGGLQAQLAAAQQVTEKAVRKAASTAAAEAASIERQGAADALRAQREGYEAKMRQAQAEADKHRIDVEELQAHLSAAEGEVDSLRAVVAAHRSKEEESLRSTEVANGSVNGSRSVTPIDDEKEILMAQMREQLETLVQEKSDAKRELVRMQHENKALRERVAMLEPSADRSAPTNQVSDEEFNAVVEELEDLRQAGPMAHCEQLEHLRTSDAMEQEGALRELANYNEVKRQLALKTDQLAKTTARFNEETETLGLELYAAQSKLKRYEASEAKLQEQLSALQRNGKHEADDKTSRHGVFSRLQELEQELIHAKMSSAEAQYQLDSMKMEMQKSRAKNLALAKKMTALEVQLVQKTAAAK
eukprot:jgi/Chlat1/6309/Chrsp44S05787